MALTAVACFSLAAAELRIGTVDLQKVMSDYYRSQQLLNQLKQKEGSFLKEMEGMRLEVRKLAKETEDLRELTVDTALSAAERQAKKKSFELKLTDLREFEVRYDNIRAQREAEFQNYSIQSRKKILDEIISTTKQISDEGGFNLVLNANKSNPAASEVLFSKNVADITEKVVQALNATKPPETPAPTKPDGK